MCLHTKLKFSEFSCLPQILSRKAAKIGLSLIHLFKKASHVLMGCLCSKGAKDHADANSENTEPSRKKVSKTASGTNDGSKVMPDVGDKVVVAFDARISSSKSADLKGLSEPEVRGTASSALQSDFFTAEPFACDPSNLSKLPASKEYDVRLRQEEARRQRKTAFGGQGAESFKPGNENHVTRRDVNCAAESKEHAHTSSKSNSVKFNPDDSVPGFRVDPRLLPTMVQVPEFGSTRNMGGYTDDSMVPGRACSSVHVANTSTSMEKSSSHSHIPQFGATDLRNAAEVTDQNQPPDRPASSHKKNPLENHGRKFMKEPRLRTAGEDSVWGN
uniref:Uncharacterized protein n=1 Tax=Avena sativa TaxID=4498 RepID=A0ACD5YIF3_AVESA